MTIQQYILAGIIAGIAIFLLGLSIGRKLGTGERLWHARKVIQGQTRRDTHD